MLRRSHILFFISIFGFVLCLTNGFADDDGAILEGPPEFQREPERIFGTADFEKMRDLPTDSQDYSLGTKVGMLRIPHTDRVLNCTGFLVGPDLFMTNHHCIFVPLEDLEIYMDYYQEPSVDRTRGGSTAGVSAILHADARKDYALLLLDKPIGNTYGWLKLDTTTRVDSSQSVKLISHSDGRSKEIARRNSQIVDVPTDFINRYPFVLGYLADSQGGSSGSPVFLRDGTDVIAIHHSAYNFANVGTLMSSIGPEIQLWLDPKFTSSTIADQGFPVDVLITPLVLPAATFGTAPYTYSASPIPAGLSFTQASRTLTGTPTTPGTTNGTYTATDANGQTASLNFIIRVIGPHLALTPPTMANQTFSLDVPITPLTLPQATNRLPPYTYTLSPIPAGLSFTPASRTLSGRPTKLGTTKATYTATDTSQKTASLNFTIRVIPAPPLASFNPRTIANQTFPVDVPIAPLTLPLVTGGTPPYTYSLLPIPAGLSFTPASRTLSGTPTTPDTTTVIYTAADVSQQARVLNFTIRVIAPLTLNPSTIADQTFTADTAVSLTLPIATGGTAPYTYTLSPIPAGIQFDTTTRVLSGTPTTAGTTNATYTATDASRQTETLNFTITVTPAPITFNPSTIIDQTFTAGDPVNLTLPIATGGTAPYTYTLSPIPAGLQFDTTTRTLSGTPTTPTSATPTTYTATDATNASESLRFIMTVIDATPAPITFSPSTIADQTFTAGTAVQVTLPIATGGTAPYTYTLSPIPAGLQFDTTTRTLSGTPTTPTSATPTTYTATDATNASESLRFIMTVIDATPAPITFSPSTIADQTFTAGTAVQVTLPIATGGTAPYTYTLSPIPAGLQFDTTTRTLSGTPTTPTSATPTTYTATDATNASESLRFIMTVIDATPAPITFSPSTIADQTFTAGTAVQVTLPIATGGTAPYTYALSPIPAGLQFDTTTRLLSGTPTTAGTTNATYTATDASRQTETLNFTITVTPAPITFNPSTIADQTFTVDTLITPLALPAATGGTAPYTYTLSPIPAGLQFDTTTRLLSGTPTTVGTTPATYTATDTANASSSLTFTIEVAEGVILDVNADGQVTVIDLAIVALFYGTQVAAGVDLAADVNDDSSVDILDLTAVAQAIDVSAGNNSALAADDVAAVLEAIAEIEGIPEAPTTLRFSTSQHALLSGVAYRNVAAAFADAKHLATDEARLGKWMPLLKGLLHLLTEMREIPNTTALLPNYPNPFNPETWIPYHLSTPAEVTLSIYSVNGRLVRALEIGHQAAGVYVSRARAAYWDGRNSVGEPVASGVYFYTLTAGEFTATRKMLIRK